MYPRLDDWLRIKAAVDPLGRFRSDMSARLGIDQLAAHASSPAPSARVSYA
jgi:hypothetical protein